jgi:hypothetical protein
MKISRDRETVTQRGCVLALSVGLWEASKGPVEKEEIKVQAIWTVSRHRITLNRRRNRALFLMCRTAGNLQN